MVDARELMSGPVARDEHREGEMFREDIVRTLRRVSCQKPTES